jgi:hypothetical protein
MTFCNMLLGEEALPSWGSAGQARVPVPTSIVDLSRVTWVLDFLGFALDGSLQRPI